MTLLIIFGVASLVFSALAIKNGVSFVKNGFNTFLTDDATISNRSGKKAASSFGRTFKWNALAGLSWTAFVITGVVLIIQAIIG